MCGVMVGGGGQRECSWHFGQDLQADACAAERGGCKRKYMRRQKKGSWEGELACRWC